MSRSAVDWIDFLQFLSIHDALDDYLSALFFDSILDCNPPFTIRALPPSDWISQAFDWDDYPSSDWHSLDILWRKRVSESF